MDRSSSSLSPGTVPSPSGHPRRTQSKLVPDPTAVPGYAQAAKLFEQASACFQREDFAGAAALFAQAAALTPGMVAAHNNLALALRSQGQIEPAIAAFRRAIEIAPDYMPAHMNLGVTLRQQGRLEEAVDVFRRALAIEESADAQSNLGGVYQELDRFEEAAAHFRRATELKPDFANAHGNLGLALAGLNRMDEAIAAYGRALDLDPNDAAMRFNLAIARDDPERVAQTEAVCRQLVEARPNLPEAHNGLGVALQRQNRLDEALASYRKASALQPGYVQSSVNESLILLLLGRYEEAWPKYEWRRRLSTMRRVERTQPLWQGNEIASKTILLHSEQGFGDSLQFMRYVPLVAERARHVILEVPRALVRLAASLPIDNLTIVPNDLTPPAADLQCPLMGLPRIFGTRADSIPGRVPYLSPRRPIVERWSKILGGDPRLKVGIVWAGSIAHKGDRSRSIALERLAPLFALNGVAWHSLQVGPPAKDVDRLAQGAIVDLSSRLGDFAETAGALLNLDLLVAVDTAVAHLGGALARPTWIMLPFAPDWRWMLEREDSPWYPTVRLFRQPSPGDWDSVIARIGRALAEWISRRHGVAI